MFQDHLLKPVAIIGMGFTASLAQASSGMDSSDIFKRITELGSFGLVAFGVYMAFTKLGPLVVSYMERQNQSFIEALKQQRESDERINKGTRDEIREIIAAQTQSVTSKLDELKEAIKSSNSK